MLYCENIMKQPFHLLRVFFSINSWDSVCYFKGILKFEKQCLHTLTFILDRQIGASVVIDFKI